MHSHHRVTAAVVGARGYSGLELARLLLRHPKVELKACFASAADWKLSDHLPESSARAVPVLEMSELSGMDYDVVFLATPAEVSLELAPKLLAQGTQVIDLSGAFRLEPAAFEKWYGHKHSAPELLSKPGADYGLVPFAGPATTNTKLIANPGCYATSILMALVPLLKAGVIQPDSIVIDAKSGATGAGKKAAENLLFTEVEGECLPYRIGKHQHLPEITAHVKKFTGCDIDPIFVTHLLPVRRGILSSIYARLSQGQTSADVQAAFESAYRDYPLVCYGSASLKRVVGSARTQLYFEVTTAADGGDKLHLFSTIDNLMKGAASQAVENLNRLLDLSPMTGLMEVEGVL